MFQIPKLIDYMLQILVLVLNNKDGRISTHSISEELKLTHYTAAKACKILSSKKLILSIQGPKGGYTLNPDTLKLNLLDIIQIIEGPMQYAACTHSNSCNKNLTCSIKGPINIISNEINSVLKKYNLTSFSSLGQQYA